MDEQVYFNDNITLFADFDSANMSRYERIPVVKNYNSNQFMTTSSNNFFSSTLDDRSISGKCFFKHGMIIQ
jgi:hypothetical protein